MVEAIVTVGFLEFRSLVRAVSFLVQSFLSIEVSSATILSTSFSASATERDVGAEAALATAALDLPRDFDLFSVGGSGASRRVRA